MATAQARATALLEAGEPLDTEFWIEQLKTIYPHVIKPDDRDFERYNKLLLMYQQKEHVDLTCVLILAGLYVLFPVNARSIEDDFNFLLAMRLSQSNMQEVFYMHGIMLLKKRFHQTLRYMEQHGVDFAVVHLKYAGDLHLSKCQDYDGTVDSLLRVQLKIMKD